MKSKYCVVTFCNQHFAEQPAIAALVDLERGDARPLITREMCSGKENYGATGLALMDDGYMLCLQGAPNRLVRLDHQWNAVDEITSHRFSRLHGVLVDGQELYVVCTDLDAVIRIDLNEPEKVSTFSFRPRKRHDYFHLNDLCRTPDGRIVAARFGAQSPDRTRSGDIVDIRTGVVLYSGLREPHSVVCAAGAIHVLESVTGNLFELKLARDGTAAASPRTADDGGVRDRFLGYVRGLWIDGDEVIVGRSGFRKHSSSRLGKAHRRPVCAPGEEAAASASGLYVKSAGDERFRFIDLAHLGSEIYSVVGIGAERPLHLEPLERRFAVT